MPIVNGKYVAPTWANDTSPALNASEMQAISDSIEQLPIANGGTGATTVAGARSNLGLGNTTGALPIANGGTGATDANTARANLGITPANIGAVSKSGDTINGDLTVTGTLNAGSLANTVPITKGGTGATTASGARDNLGVTTALNDLETSLTSKINYINNSRTTNGVINCYNTTSHSVGTGFDNIKFNNVDYTVPFVIFDGSNKLPLLRDLTGANGSLGNAHILGISLDTSSSTWKLAIRIKVDSTEVTKYLSLSNS